MTELIYQLQKDLHTLHFDPGVLDGQWGSHTRGACHDAKEKYPTLPEVTSPPSPEFCSAVRELAKAEEAKQPSRLMLPPNYLDLTAMASTGWKKCDRPWSQISGVTLHQTGCPYPSAPSRWYGLKAHYGITYEGGIYRIRKETDFGWHAQQLSKTDIGIEIAGFFCGIEEDLKTRPGGPKDWAVQSVTDRQIEAVKDLMRYLAQLLLVNGSALRFCHAHRQATDDRQPDPGSKVWQEIALPMMAELRLSDGGDGWTIGRGMKIPHEWDERRSAKY